MPGFRAAIGICTAILLSATQATAQEPYYKGKRLSVLVNYAPGGPTDIEGRLFARHIGKHIAIAIRQLQMLLVCTGLIRHTEPISGDMCVVEMLVYMLSVHLSFLHLRLQV